MNSAAMEDFLGHSRWQIVQIGASVFELRYMPTNKDIAVDARGLRALLKKALGADVAIQIKAVAALGPTSSGKFPPIANRFSN